jgi:hypothetical protein
MKPLFVKLTCDDVILSVDSNMDSHFEIMGMGVDITFVSIK